MLSIFTAPDLDTLSKAQSYIGGSPSHSTSEIVSLHQE